MKYLMSAIALVIAAPAAAQTAPAQPHQDHGQHQQHGQGQPQPQAPAQHGQHQQGQHQERGDCCADRNGNGRMDCCEHMAEAGDRRGRCCEEHRAQPSAPSQAHQDH